MTGPAERPLTPAQAGIWFAEQWEHGGRPATATPDGTKYHINGSLRLRGHLDPEALRRALAALLERHPVLRGRVVERDRPVLADPGPTPLAVPVTDLRGSGPRAEELALERLREELARPFDLARGPLLRAGLVRLADQDHLLVLVVHHLVCDGTSLRVLYRDLGALYRNGTGGPDGPGPAGPSWFDGAGGSGDERRAAALEHFTAVLKDAPTIAELPLDRPRTEAAHAAGAALQLPVPAELWRAVLAAGARWRATPYMVLTAAYTLLLARLGGARDLVIGTPSAGRTEPGQADQVGMFVTTLPLRLRLTGTTTCEELVQQVRGQVMATLQHQDASLEEIVDALALPRSVETAPLVQTVCSMEWLDIALPELPGATVSRAVLPCTAAKFDLSLGVEASAAGAVTDWEYQSALFDAGTVRALAHAYLALLAAMVAAPAGQPALRVPMALPRTGPAPAGHPAVPGRIARQALATPEAVALRLSGGACVTYRQFDERARAVAAALRAAGAGPESTVLLGTPRGVPWAVGLLGIWYSGAAAVLVDLNWPRERLESLAARSGARHGVAESAREWGAGLSWVATDAGPADASFRPAEPAPGALAYVLFTSGSTGEPKPVAVGHGALAHHAEETGRRFGLTSADRVLQFAAPAFDVSLEETVPTWCAGASVALVPDSTVAPTEWEELLTEHGATVANLPTPYWAEWARDLELRPRALPEALRLVVIGSDTGRTADAARWYAAGGPPLLNAYGLTESTVTATVHRVRGAEPSPVLPIGLPLPGVRAQVLDSALQVTPDGLAGELYLGGPGLARGYHGQPARTASRFLPDPYAPEPGARMYRTGDLVRRLADGTLLFLGRADSQVKIRGHRVELREVEAALAALPGVTEAVVRADSADGATRLTGYAATAPGSGLDAAAARELLVGRLPGHLVPARIVLLAELPRTPGGKLDVAALPLPSGPTPPAEPSAPADAQGVLAAIWCELLGVAEVRGEDNFFRLGGDSILSIRVVSRARAAGIELTTRDLFRHQSLAELAEAVRGRGAPAAAPAPVLAEDLLPDRRARWRLLARARDAAAVAAAGPMQRWGLNRLAHAPRPQLYRAFEAYDVSGDTLDPDLLVLAWQAAAEAHPALRSSLHRTGGQDLRVTHRAARIAVHREEFAAGGEALGEQALADHLAQLRTRPARPEDPDHLELALFAAGDRLRIAWSFNYLHIDGWSFPPLLRSVLAAHEALREGRSPVFPELPGTELVAAEWPASEGPEARAHWQGRLAGRPPGLVTELLGPGSGPAESRDLRSRMPAEATARLGAELRAHGLTLHTAVQAAYGLALAALAGTDDVLFGAVVSGRSGGAEGVEQAVGCLNNILPVRVRHPQGGAAADWLRALQAEKAESGRYEHTGPLAVQRWCGVPDDGQLYDSYIVVQNFPFDPGVRDRLAGWRLLGNGARGDEALRLTVWPDAELLLKLTYDRDLVDDRRAADLLARVAAVLALIADALDRPFAELLRAARRG
ncbi:amino acid adenylation domain-containing protein [Kitasatospora sp. NPDC002227]|uniref:non-ribosomal peptide synthetase n=1 Tax=Kitasatospora sp. NPDC002227 TaxID=3154773 RepID=UPI003325AFEF